jgi:hypothetical protein
MDGRWFRRPAVETLEDRLPVSENIGTVAGVMALAGAARTAPPPAKCAN